MILQNRQRQHNGKQQYCEGNLAKAKKRILLIYFKFVSREQGRCDSDVRHNRTERKVMQAVDADSVSRKAELEVQADELN